MPDYTHKSNSEYENDYEDENQYLDLKNRKSPIDTFQAQLKAHLSGQPLETSIQAYFCQQAALKPDPPLRHRIRGAMSHIDPTQRSNYEPESLYAIIATYYDIPQEIEPYQSPSGRYEYRYTNQELIQEIYRDILLLNNIHNQQDHSQYHIGKEILLPTRDYAQHLKAQYQSPEKTQTQTQTAKPETTESLYTKQLEQLKAELNPEERQALDQLLAHKQNLEQTEEKPYDIQNGIPVFDPGKFRNHQEVYQYISLQIQQGDNYFAQHFSIQRLDSPRRQKHLFELAGQTYEYVFPAAPKDTPIAAPEKDKPLPEKPSRGLPKDEKDFWEHLANFFRTYGGELGELSLSTIPIIGDVYDVVCAVLGRSLVTGEKFDYTDRFLTLLGLIPLPLVSGKLLRYGKGFVEWLLGKQLIRELFEHYIRPAREYIERKWKALEDYFRGKPKAEPDTEQEQKAGVFGGAKKQADDVLQKILEADKKKYPDLKKAVEQNPGLEGIWKKLSQRSEWVRTNTELLSKLLHKSDDFIERIDDFYKNFVPKNITPPGKFNNLEYNKFGFPIFTNHSPGAKFYYNGSLVGRPGSLDNLNAMEWLDKNPNLKKDIDYKWLGTGNNAGKGTILIKHKDKWIPCTWHHHEDGKTLMPVFKDIHDSLLGKHTGGGTIIKNYPELIGFFNSP